MTSSSQVRPFPVRGTEFDRMRTARRVIGVVGVTFVALGVRATAEVRLPDGPNRELVITHNGREYRLRLTQNGKLILTA